MKIGEIETKDNNNNDNNNDNKNGFLIGGNQHEGRRVKRVGMLEVDQEGPENARFTLVRTKRYV